MVYLLEPPTHKNYFWVKLKLPIPREISFLLDINFDTVEGQGVYIFLLVYSANLWGLHCKSRLRLRLRYGLTGVAHEAY